MSPKKEYTTNRETEWTKPTPVLDNYKKDRDFIYKTVQPSLSPRRKPKKQLKYSQMMHDRAVKMEEHIYKKKTELLAKEAEECTFQPNPEKFKGKRI